MNFKKEIPNVGHIVRVAVGDFLMDARVKYRYANPTTQQIVLDVTYTPSSSLPIELVNEEGVWKVSLPEKCPFYGKEVSVTVIG
jgi:hypothetical protein